MPRRWSLLVLVFAIALGVARIVATYEVFGETFDEGVHLAAGMELLDRGTFTYEPKHPPLARVMVALGPWLDGSRSHGDPNIWGEGVAIIHADDPDRTLALARLGILPFFILGTVMLWGWTRYLAGEAEAAIAALLFTSTPIVLASASVATTDMALTATLTALLFVSTRWLESPTPMRSVALGVSGAATLTAKMSSIAFFGGAAVLVLALRWWWRRAPGVTSRTNPPVGVSDGGALEHLRQLAVVVPVGLLCVWAVYGFQAGTLHGVPFPLTTLIQGVRDMIDHNDVGQASFLLGRSYVDGHLMFFPVGIGVKAPLTLLTLGLAGAGLLLSRARGSRDWRMAVPLLAALAVLGVSIPARINIGVRHVLPVFTVLSLCGGIAAMAAWRRAGRRGRVALSALSIAGLWSTLSIHPDYLAYFNELAGRHPERVLVDSDLDWGQDLRRLRDTLAARGIDTVTTAYFGSALPRLYGIPAQRWKRDKPVHGWFVVSQTHLQRGDAVLRGDQWTLNPDAFDWLDALEPTARIGKSLLLYHVP